MDREIRQYIETRLRSLLLDLCPMNETLCDTLFSYDKEVTVVKATKSKGEKEQEVSINNINVLKYKFQTLEILSRKFPDKIKSFVHELYNYDNCVSSLEIFIDGDLDWKELVKQFSNKIKGCDKYFIFNFILSSETKGHANLLIVEKEEKQINFFRYEPNGPEYDFSDKDEKILRSLLEDTGKELNTPIKIYNKTDTCPIGIQKKSKDTYGYCIMFSLFWFYCLVKLLDSKLPLKDLIQYIEPVLSSVINSFKKEKMIVDCFEKNNTYIGDFSIRYLFLVVYRFSDRMTTEMIEKYKKDEDTYEVIEYKIKDNLFKEARNVLNT
jgi:hypothetical protein